MGEGLGEQEPARGTSDLCIDDPSTKGEFWISYKDWRAIIPRELSFRMIGTRVADSV